MDAETKLILSWFPKLQKDELYRLTSPATSKYNCIAWATTEDDFNLWPYQNDGVPATPKGSAYRWPRDVAKDFSVETFQKLFRQYGYEPFDNLIPERGYEYICLYVNDEDEVTHAARQLPDGSWTSKLGVYQDIRHSLHALEGEIYGTVRCIMRRKK